VPGSLRRKIQSLGWADTFWLGVDQLLRRITLGSARLSKYYFVAQPVAAGAIEKPPGTGMRLYVADTLDDIVRQAPLAAPALQQRFAQRSRCVVAESDGTLAGFIWLCPDRYREEKVRCHYRWVPAASAEWDYDVFIAPRHRMGRLFGRLWERAHALLASQGVRWTLSYIDAFNPGSLAAHRSLGARDLARGWFLVLGRRQVTFATVAPYVHLSMHEHHVPLLLFDLTRLEPAALAGPRPSMR
jgi:hypothetical protein